MRKFSGSLSFRMFHLTVATSHILYNMAPHQFFFFLTYSCLSCDCNPSRWMMCMMYNVVNSESLNKLKCSDDYNGNCVTCMTEWFVKEIHQPALPPKSDE